MSSIRPSASTGVSGAALSRRGPGAPPDATAKSILSLLLPCLAAIGLCVASCATPARDASPISPPLLTEGVDSGAPAADEPPASVRNQPERIVREGIAVEFSVVPVDPERQSSGELFEGDDVRVQFRITDTATDSPVTTLEPAAWMHPSTSGVECRAKIRSFLEANLSTRAEIDLNVYYVLSLNDDSSVSVVDPLFGYGGSKLLAMAILRSPGEDWALSHDQSRLFVTMPLVNQVAVVDTSTWKVITNIDTGQRPVRIALQPDGKYVWVGSDGVNSLDLTSGVTIIDTESLEKVTQIPTGVGHHEIAFTGDDRYALVTNTDADTLSVIDIRALDKVKDIDCGVAPVSVDYSSLSGAAYVVSREEGTILVVDGRSLEIKTRIQAEPGLGAIRFSPDGRFGFVVNSTESVVHIIDAATNRLVQTADVGEGPDQVAFTENLAYVRSSGSEIVLMIPLDEIGREGAPVPVVDFTGGHAPFGKNGRPSVADGIVPAPGGTAVLVANPVDQSIYYYREGMAAPMGEFHNYGRQPRAVLVVDRSLVETEPGVYSTDIRLSVSGELDVPLFLESPRILHCFSLEVLPDPDAPLRDDRPVMQIQSLIGKTPLEAGERTQLRFKVMDPRSEQPRADLKDLSVLAASPGNWHNRQIARSVGEGVYEVEFLPPRPGAYFISFQCNSLNVKLNELPPLMVQVVNKG